jgi:uncharacterized protein YihD (DUF1040 family)
LAKELFNTIDMIETGVIANAAQQKNQLQLEEFVKPASKSFHFAKNEIYQQIKLKVFNRLSNAISFEKLLNNLTDDILQYLLSLSREEFYKAFVAENGIDFDDLQNELVELETNLDEYKNILEKLSKFRLPSIENNNDGSQNIKNNQNKPNQNIDKNKFILNDKKNEWTVYSDNNNNDQNEYGSNKKKDDASTAKKSSSGAFW